MPDEPQFMAVSSQSDSYKQTVADARATLSSFRELAPALAGTEAFPSIKTELQSGDDQAFIWLLVEQVTESGFLASVFEMPRDFSEYGIGDKLHVPDSAVVDWMFHDDGTLHGGFSLRYQRTLLPPEERPNFDAHIGVTAYA